MASVVGERGRDKRGGRATGATVKIHLHVGDARFARVLAAVAIGVFPNEVTDLAVADDVAAIHIQVHRIGWSERDAGNARRSSRTIALAVGLIVGRRQVRVRATLVRCGVSIAGRGSDGYLVIAGAQATEQIMARAVGGCGRDKRGGRATGATVEIYLHVGD